MLKRILISAICAAILSSCTTADSLKRVTPKGDRFSHHLFEMYKEFSEREAKMCDWMDSSRFAHKAMKIAYGHNVPPEKVEKWHISKDQIAAMQQKRLKLMQLLDNKNLRAEYPQVLAKAQFSFDCLLEESEENWQVSDIKKCSDDFEGSIAFLDKHNNRHSGAVHHKHHEHAKKKHDEKPKHEHVKHESPKKHENKKHNEIKDKKSSSPKNKEIEKKIHKEEAKKSEVKKESKAKFNNEYFAYRIFFDGKGDNLNDTAKNMLVKISKEIKNMKKQPHEIVLNSYTNKAGREEDNFILSKRRASLVKKFLISQGISSKNIVIYAFGEADTVVDTPISNTEFGGKRVDISIVD